MLAVYSVVLPPSLTVFLYCSLLVYRPPARSGRTLSQSTKTQVQSHPWSYQYDHTFIHPSIHVFTTFFDTHSFHVYRKTKKRHFRSLLEEVARNRLVFLLLPLSDPSVGSLSLPLQLERRTRSPIPMTIYSTALRGREKI